MNILKPKRPFSLVLATVLLVLVSSVQGGKPSLRSTWPIIHSNSENSDFVPLAGARGLVPKWEALQVRPAATFVALGPEGNLYTVTMDAGPCHLYALDKEGSMLWCF